MKDNIICSESLGSKRMKQKQNEQELVKFIRMHLLENDIPTAVFCQQVQMAQSAWSTWKNGKRSARIEELHRIAAYLDKSLEVNITEK